MNTVIVSLMCHPDNDVKIELPSGDFDCFLNKERGYGNAVRHGIKVAVGERKDIVFADTDGYHPPSEIRRLANLCPGEGSYIVKPYRENLGFQSKVYSSLYSAVKGKEVRDATGGLYRLSLDFMDSLPALASEDMTIGIEILNHAIRKRVPIIQFPYHAAENDREISKRTNGYQRKLLKAMIT